MCQIELNELEILHKCRQCGGPEFYVKIEKIMDGCDEETYKCKFCHQEYVKVIL